MTEDLAAPRLKAPPGTCDTHLHIYGPKETYPEAPTSPFPAPFAPVDAYEKVMARLGIDRAVIVQPSAYAKDNRCTLDAVAKLGLHRAKAVVVIDTEASDDTLEALTSAGAVGIRFHMLPGGVLGWDIIEEMAARVTEHGWHVQLQLDGRLFPEKEAVIRRLPGRLVIDHTGKFLEPVKTGDPAFKAMLGLVERGNTWVKLSAPYETSKSGPPTYDDVGDLARGLIAAAPERMMWASNWPHPSAQPNPPDDAMLLDMMLEWCPDEAVRRKILVDNPAGLYGFG